MELPKRKSPRMAGFDYSSNKAYFITICTDKRKNMFSDIVGAIHESPEIKLNGYGRIAENYINAIENRFGITVDNYVIMPNHIHLILFVDNDERAIRESPLHRRHLVPKAIGFLKMNISRDIHKQGFEGNIWQRSFHDHIIRGEKDYRKIYEYISSNPSLWQEDKFYNDVWICAK